MTRLWHIVSKSGRLRSRRAKLLIAFVVALVAAAGAAAYFTSTGHGTATASVATAQNITISAGTASTPLFPGGSADVALTISNPNPFPVHVGSLASDTGQGTNGFAVDNGHSGCNLSSLSFTTQTNSSTGWTVPAKVATNGSLPLDLPGAIGMDATAVNACQGASFTVYLKAGP